MLPSNVVVSCKQVLAAQGLKGIYVGFGVTLMRDVPEIAIQFTVYDTMLRTLQSQQVCMLCTLCSWKLWVA